MVDEAHVSDHVMELEGRKFSAPECETSSVILLKFADVQTLKLSPYVRSLQPYLERQRENRSTNESLLAPFLFQFSLVLVCSACTLKKLARCQRASAKQINPT